MIKWAWFMHDESIRLFVMYGTCMMNHKLNHLIKVLRDFLLINIFKKVNGLWKT